MRILIGSDCERIFNVLKEQGCGFILDQNLGISVKWAEKRGFVFKQKEIVAVELSAPQRPVMEALGEEEKFD